jgi:predicted CXXCH cytochrome family protein
MVIPLCSLNVWGAINGSKHDLSYLDFSLKKDDGFLCIFCHTPHGMNSKFSGNALWDTEQSVHETTYIVYDENTTEQNSANSSKACLSCHDGVSAVNSVIEVSLSVDVTSAQNIHKSNFFDDGHPISIPYDENKASLNPKSGLLGAKTKEYSAIWHTPDGSQNIDAVLRSNKVECASCHDPHLGENATFLRVKSNQRSFLCLGCHSK